MEDKAVITGATGFLGSNLAKKLNSLGFKVVALGRNRQKGSLLQNEGIEFVCADLSDKDEISNALKGARFVFHCAAKSSLWGRYKDFYNSNVLGTKNMLDLAKKSGAERFIHVSTPSIYFDFKDRFNIKEDEKLPEQFVNNYAQTKYLAEIEADKAFKDGLNVITIRPRGIYGTGDTALIPRLIRANQEKFIPKTVKDDILIDITHVQNVVESLICAMKADAVCFGKKYNITDGTPVHFYKMLEELLAGLGYSLNVKNLNYSKTAFLAGVMENFYKTFLPDIEPVFTKYYLGLLSFNMTLDIKKAREELGYTPLFSTKEGIKKVIEGK